jgi:hypothetical protein
VLRWAALLHDIGKPATRRHEPDGGVSFHHHEVVGAKMARKRMRALKYSKQMIDDVSQLVYLHLRFHGYGDGRWTDSAVRRYVADAGPLLPRLHKLVRADCTTRNKRRAARLQANYDDLEARIAELAARRPGAGPPRPGRQRHHGVARHPGRPAGRGGVELPQGTPVGSRSAVPMRPPPNCWRGGTPGAAPASDPVMDYCLGDGAGGASMWTGSPRSTSTVTATWTASGWTSTATAPSMTRWPISTGTASPITPR